MVGFTELACTGAAIFLIYTFTDQRTRSGTLREFLTVVEVLLLKLKDVTLSTITSMTQTSSVSAGCSKNKTEDSPTKLKTDKWSEEDDVEDAQTSAGALSKSSRSRFQELALVSGGKGTLSDTSSENNWDATNSTVSLEPTKENDASDKSMVITFGLKIGDETGVSASQEEGKTLHQVDDDLEGEMKQYETMEQKQIVELAQAAESLTSENALKNVEPEELSQGIIIQESLQCGMLQLALYLLRFDNAMEQNGKVAEANGNQRKRRGSCDSYFNRGYKINFAPKGHPEPPKAASRYVTEEDVQTATLSINNIEDIATPRRLRRSMSVQVMARPKDESLTLFKPKRKPIQMDEKPEAKDEANETPTATAETKQAAKPSQAMTSAKQESKAERRIIHKKMERLFEKQLLDALAAGMQKLHKKHEQIEKEVKRKSFKMKPVAVVGKKESLKNNKRAKPSSAKANVGPQTTSSGSKTVTQTSSSKTGKSSWERWKAKMEKKHEEKERRKLEPLEKPRSKKVSPERHEHTRRKRPAESEKRPREAKAKDTKRRWWTKFTPAWMGVEEENADEERDGTKERARRHEKKEAHGENATSRKKDKKSNDSPTDPDDLPKKGWSGEEEGKTKKKRTKKHKDRSSVTKRERRPPETDRGLFDSPEERPMSPQYDRHKDVGSLRRRKKVKSPMSMEPIELDTDMEKKLVKNVDGNVTIKKRKNRNVKHKRNKKSPAKNDEKDKSKTRGGGTKKTHDKLKKKWSVEDNSPETRDNLKKVHVPDIDKDYKEEKKETKKHTPKTKSKMD